MLTLILSIIYWCKPNLNTLGIIAIILSVFGAVGDFILYGWLCIIDIIVLVVNIMVYEKHKNNDNNSGGNLNE